MTVTTTNERIAQNKSLKKFLTKHPDTPTEDVLTKFPGMTGHQVGGIRRRVKSDLGLPPGRAPLKSAEAKGSRRYVRRSSTNGTVLVDMAPQSPEAPPKRKHKRRNKKAAASVPAVRRELLPSEVEALPIVEQLTHWSRTRLEGEFIATLTTLQAERDEAKRNAAMVIAALDSRFQA